MFRKSLQFILKILSKLVLKKYQPDVIAITGSIGKTSARDAIYSVLSSKFAVRRNNSNFNNEIGLPLTIFGEKKSGGKNLFKWILIILRVLALLFKKSNTYPDILILEMGADRPGDISYLIKIARPHVGVITAISEAHIEFFKTIKNIAKEKSGVVSGLTKNDFALLNADDALALEMKDKTKAKVLTFGFSDNADLKAQDAMISSAIRDVNKNGRQDLFIRGYNFKLSYEGSIVPVLLPGVLGKHQIYAALAAAACGIIYGMNLVQISESFQTYTGPKGRMNLLPGIKYTQIIDDTYNASPQAVTEALNTLGRIEVPVGRRKIAVLGDMLELGAYTEEAHKKVGELVAKNHIDDLIVVGNLSIGIVKEAKKMGMDENNIFSFNNSEDAGKFLQNRMKEGDLILVKGSQGVRMEKIVKEVMAEPLRAKEFLVRQSDEWLAR